MKWFGFSAHLVDEVCERSERVFMWVHLVTISLLECLSDGGKILRPTNPSRGPSESSRTVVWYHSWQNECLALGASLLAVSDTLDLVAAADALNFLGQVYAYLTRAPTAESGLKYSEFVCYANIYLSLNSMLLLSTAAQCEPFGYIVKG